MTFFELTPDQLNLLSVAIARVISECYTINQQMLIADFLGSLESNLQVRYQCVSNNCATPPNIRPTNNSNSSEEC